LTNQAPYNTQNGQVYVPTGIHWQGKPIALIQCQMAHKIVGQATSITNCNFKMSVSTSNQTATGVGIMMENGSGGFMSDLTFFGGNAGMVAGSQQFTMRKAI
jgi:glucan 1,3-beta-glucosidase